MSRCREVNGGVSLSNVEEIKFPTFNRYLSNYSLQGTGVSAGILRHLRPSFSTQGALEMDGANEGVWWSQSQGTPQRVVMVWGREDWAVA